MLVATHFNTGTYHNHFVVNPVNMWTGKKLEAKCEVYYKLRDMSDRICKEHGLSVVKNPQRHKTARPVYFAEKNGEPTRYNLMRRALDEALTMSSSWTELSLSLIHISADPLNVACAAFKTSSLDRIAQINGIYTFSLRLRIT